MAVRGRACARGVRGEDSRGGDLTGVMKGEIDLQQVQYSLTTEVHIQTKRDSA